MEKIKIKNKRLAKYLYSLGFDRECGFDKNEYLLLYEKEKQRITNNKEMLL